MKYRRYRFAVTFERVTAESAELGDAESRGYVLHNATLRDAIEALQGAYCEPDSWPISLANPPRWFTAYRTNEGTRDYYDAGVEESRSLHLPRNITPSSAIRIARLLGIET